MNTAQRGKKRYIIPIALVVASIVLWVYARQKNDAAAKDNDRANAGKAIPVKVTSLEERTFEQRVVVQGNLEAQTFANVSARVGGTIDTIFVEEGSKVVAGTTKLFQIDPLKLKKTVEIRKQDLAVARCALAEKEANLERYMVDLEKAEKDMKRYERLHKVSAVSEDELEIEQTRYKEALAMTKYARSLVELEKEKYHQSEASLAMAEKDLSDSLVYAPINGVVSGRFMEPGEMGGVGVPVLRIDDISVVEVSAFLPADSYAAVGVGKTKMRVRLSKLDLGEQVISYKSPTINSKLRTFEIKCILRNPPEGVVPGRLAEIEVLLEQRQGSGIPREAVQIRGGKSVVFIVNGEKAHMKEVTTGLETDGYVEILRGNIDTGTPVVTMGQFLLDNGSPVRVQKEDV